MWSKEKAPYGAFLLLEEIVIRAITVFGVFEDVFDIRVMTAVFEIPHYIASKIDIR